MIKKLLVLVLCVGVLASCSKEPIPQEVESSVENFTQDRSSSGVILLGDWTLTYFSSTFVPNGNTLYCPYDWEFKLDGTRPEVSYNRWRNDCVYRYTSTVTYQQTSPTSVTMGQTTYTIVQGFSTNQITLIEDPGQPGSLQRVYKLTR